MARKFDLNGSASGSTGASTAISTKISTIPPPISAERLRISRESTPGLAFTPSAPPAEEIESSDAISRSSAAG
ncbi:hypothetical protein D3C86_1912590 [compost metagenome]